MTLFNMGSSNSTAIPSSQTSSNQNGSRPSGNNDVGDEIDSETTTQPIPSTQRQEATSPPAQSSARAMEPVYDTAPASTTRRLREMEAERVAERMLRPSERANVIHTHYHHYNDRSTGVQEYTTRPEPELFAQTAREMMLQFRGQTVNQATLINTTHSGEGNNDEASEILVSYPRPQNKLPKHDSSGSSIKDTGDDTSVSNSPVQYSCFIKARTREHDDRKETKKSIWFEGKPGGVLKIGSDKDSGLQLQDDRCDKTHALIKYRATTINHPDGTTSHRDDLVLFPLSRMYRLLPAQYMARINIGTVFKLGSISLEVINMNILCTDDATGDETSPDVVGYLGPYLLDVKKDEKTGRTLVYTREKDKNEPLPPGNELSMKNVTKSINDALQKLKINEEAAGADVDDHQDHTDPVESKQGHDIDEVMCYICWSGMHETQQLPTSDVNNVVANFDDELENDNYADSQLDELMKKNNPMIKNPCNTCSGCSQFIHYECLMKWIKTSKSGHCSICNNPLPAEFCCKPPNLELKVIRHRRGHHWTGTRRFRLSFAEQTKRTLGSSSRCDIRLPDCSISETHCAIKFHKEKKEFYIFDCNSRGGTYIQITEPVVLNEAQKQLPNGRGGWEQQQSGFTGESSEYKIGRSTVGIRVEQSKERKKSMLSMLHRSGWRNNSSNNNNVA